MLVREVMTTEPITVRVETSVREALGLLDQHSITSLPVVADDSVVVGVLSEADLLVGRLLHDDRSSILPRTAETRGTADSVEAVMSRRPVTVTEGTDLADVARIMSSTGFKSMPVVDSSGRLVGVVSRRDIVRTLARSDADIEHDLTDLFRTLDVDWVVRVQDGRVRISGATDDKARSLAHAVASTVAGVLHVSFD